MMIIGEAADVVAGVEEGDEVEDVGEGVVVVEVEDHFGIPFEGDGMQKMVIEIETAICRLRTGDRIDRLRIATVTIS